MQIGLAVALRCESTNQSCVNSRKQKANSDRRPLAKKRSASHDLCMFTHSDTTYNIYIYIFVYYIHGWVATEFQRDFKLQGSPGYHSLHNMKSELFHYAKIIRARALLRQTAVGVTTSSGSTTGGVVQWSRLVQSGWTSTLVHLGMKIGSCVSNCGVESRWA